MKHNDHIVFIASVSNDDGFAGRANIMMGEGAQMNIYASNIPVVIDKSFYREIQSREYRTVDLTLEINQWGNVENCDISITLSDILRDD